MPEIAKRQKSFPACGRLVVLEPLGNGKLLDILNGPNKFVVIAFPSMPEVIELARRAEYAVSSPIGFPDGIHQYKGTQPLKIPLSFKLHSFDSEYCPHGAKTLLELAAVMQALTLPVGDSKSPVTWQTSATSVGAPEAKDEGALKARAAEETSSYHPVDRVNPPPTCYLELVLTDRESVGIACIGYVEDVKVRLRAPFMKGPGISQNLPSAGEFEFTFVHHPGHGNAFNANAAQNFIEEQAYAHTVKDRLYNTIGLLSASNSFAGFNSSAAPATGTTLGGGGGVLVTGGGDPTNGYGRGGSWTEKTPQEKEQEQRNRELILRSKGFMR